MGTAELNNTKKELVGWIKSLTDDSMLALLNSFKLSNEGKSADWWNELSETDRDNILLGIQDFQKGDTMNSKEFWNGLNNG